MGAICELDRREGTQGQDVALTIDLELQKSVLERLGLMLVAPARW